MNGQFILKQSVTSDISTKGCIIVSNQITSIYLAILDENRDMMSAVSHMDVLDLITPAAEIFLL